MYYLICLIESYFDVHLVPIKIQLELLNINDLKTGCMFSVICSRFFIIWGLKMNPHYSFKTALRDILQVVNPTEDDWSKRFQVINDLRAVVQSLEVLRGKYTTLCHDCHHVSCANVMSFYLTSEFDCAK